MGFLTKKTKSSVKMLPQMMSRLLNGSRGVMKNAISRNFGVTAVALKELDPVQALFIEEIKAKLAGEYEKIARMYGAESGGMDEFPTFAFEEPLLEALATDHVADLKTALTS